MIGRADRDTQAPSANLREATVLVVEDSPDDAQIAVRALERFGMSKIFHAETGEDALALLAERPCDVVLVDYHLPGMDGIAFVERAREAYPDLRLIMVTGTRDEQLVVSAMKLGASDYLTKDDFLTSAIVRSLQGVLRGRLDASTAERAHLLSPNGTWDKVREEADWLAERWRAGAAAPDASEGALDVFEADSRLSRRGGATEEVERVIGLLEQYIRRSSSVNDAERFADEEALVRILVAQGWSPAQLVMGYRAVLRSFAAEGVKPSVSPMVCLAKLTLLMIEQYQLNQSLESLGHREA